MINCRDCLHYYEPRRECLLSTNAQVFSPDYGCEFGQRRFIRCRDCRYYREHMWVNVEGFGTDIEHVCVFFTTGVKVDPDGYCSWAELKDIRTKAKLCERCDWFRYIKADYLDGEFVYEQAICGLTGEDVKPKITDCAAFTPNRSNHE